MTKTQWTPDWSSPTVGAVDDNPLASFGGELSQDDLAREAGYGDSRSGLDVVYGQANGDLGRQFVDQPVVAASDDDDRTGKAWYGK